MRGTRIRWLLVNMVKYVHVREAATYSFYADEDEDEHNVEALSSI